MTIQTRLRDNSPNLGGGGGGSSNSGGLASTGGLFVMYSSQAGTFPFSKVLAQGANITLTTDATSIFIASNTGGASNSAGLAGTGNYYIVGSAQPLLPGSRILTAGSSITTVTDATSLYVSAITANALAFVLTSRLVNTTSPVGGGGDLSADRTITVGSLGSIGSANQFVRVNTDGATWGYINFRAGSSTTLSQGSGFIQIDATTGGGAASSAGLAGTGVFYLGTSANSTWPNWFVIQAGSSISFNFTGTNLFISAITNSASGSSTPGTYQLAPQQAKLYSSTSAARIDAGTPFFRLLYSVTTQQFGIWSLLVPADYSSNPYVRIFYGADSSIAVARSISWIVDQWGAAANQGRASGYYVDTFGGTNTVSIALSAGYSSGTVQTLTIPLATTVSFSASRLINLRISGSGGPMGNVEMMNSTLEYTKA